MILKDYIISIFVESSGANRQRHNRSAEEDIQPNCPLEIMMNGLEISNFTSYFNFLSNQSFTAGDIYRMVG